MSACQAPRQPWEPEYDSLLSMDDHLHRLAGAGSLLVSLTSFNHDVKAVALFPIQDVVLEVREAFENVWDDVTALRTACIAEIARSQALVDASPHGQMADLDAYRAVLAAAARTVLTRLDKAARS